MVSPNKSKVLGVFLVSGNSTRKGLTLFTESAKGDCPRAMHPNEIAGIRSLRVAMEVRRDSIELLAVCLHDFLYERGRRMVFRIAHDGNFAAV